MGEAYPAAQTSIARRPPVPTASAPDVNRNRWIALLLVLRLTAPLWFVVYIVDAKRLFSPRAMPIARWHAAPGRALRSFEAGPGVVIRGYELSPSGGRSPRGYAIFFHGSAGLVQDDLAFLAWLRGTANLDVSDFDFRGCGFSAGDAGISATWSDALREYDDVHARAAARGLPTFVYGYSLGTAVATYVAEHRRPDGVILQSAPYDLDREIDYVTAPYRFPLELTGAHPYLSRDAEEFFASASRIRHVDEPLLVVHGSGDRLVDVREGHDLFERASSRDKHFVAVPGLDHLGWIPPTVGGRAVVEFVSRVAKSAR